MAIRLGLISIVKRGMVVTLLFQKSKKEGVTIFLRESNETGQILHNDYLMVNLNQFLNFEGRRFDLIAPLRQALNIS